MQKHNERQQWVAGKEINLLTEKINTMNVLYGDYKTQFWESLEIALIDSSSVWREWEIFGGRIPAQIHKLAKGPKNLMNFG